MELRVSEGATVQLASADVVLESSEWNGPKTLTIAWISGLPLHERSLTRYEPTAVLPGSIFRKNLGPLAEPGVFRIAFGTPPFKTSLPAVTSFTVQLPEMIVNDRPNRFAPLRFEAYRGQTRRYFLGCTW